jgi:hypothetical protein
VRLFGRVNDFLLTCVKFPVADIVRDGPGKQIDILLDNTDIPS